MLVGSISLTESVGAARGKQAPGKAAGRLAWLEWNRQFSEEARRLNKVEPLPDNFEDICRGKARPPVYSS